MLMKSPITEKWESGFQPVGPPRVHDARMAGSKERIDLMNEKPKTLKQALAMLKSEREVVAIQTCKFLAEEEKAIEAQRGRRTAEALADHTKSQFADLKKKLYDAEIELSRLRGFMERVREDDAVSDPLVEITDGKGTRQVTKRFPTNLPRAHDQNNYEPFPGTTGWSERNEKPKHWTSY